MQFLSSILLLLLAGSYFALRQCPGRNITLFGHRCASNFQCRSLLPGSFCNQGVCCLNGSGLNFLHGQCPGNNISLSGNRCISNLQCRSLSPGSFCYQGICCFNGSDMVKIVPYGGYCTMTVHCSTNGAACISNICQCRNGSQYNGYSCVAISNPCPPDHILINGLCYRNITYGFSCNHTQQCGYIGAFCINGICRCQLGYIFDGSKCIRSRN